MTLEDFLEEAGRFFQENLATLACPLIGKGSCCESMPPTTKNLSS